jgi:hypothetical protein
MGGGATTAVLYVWCAKGRQFLSGREATQGALPHMTDDTSKRNLVTPQNRHGMPIGVGETPDWLLDRVNLAEIACTAGFRGDPYEMLAESSQQDPPQLIIEMIERKRSQASRRSRVPDMFKDEVN